MNIAVHTDVKEAKRTVPVFPAIICGDPMSLQLNQGTSARVHPHHLDHQRDIEVTCSFALTTSEPFARNIQGSICLIQSRKHDLALCGFFIWLDVKMADQAQRRVQALASQLSSPSSSASASPSSLPAMTRIAGPSNGRRLADKVAIITGTNSPLGIGRATAHQYAESGVKAVYICDFEDTHLAEHKREIESKYAGVEVNARKFDASNEAAVKAVVDEAMEKYGRLDVFFANAGIIGPHALFTDCSDDDFMEVLKVNTLR